MKQLKFKEVPFVTHVKELRDNVSVAVAENKAEITVKYKYKLSIFVYEDKVIAEYGNVSITVNFSKFDTEKIAKKIYAIVYQSHNFSVSIIKEALDLIISEGLYDLMLDKIEDLRKTKNIHMIFKVYNFLNSI